MKSRAPILSALAAAALSVAPWATALDKAAQAPADPPAGRPDAIVDLASKQGAALVGATWSYRDAKLVEVSARAPGLDLRPSGAPIRAITT